jgi:hypothetical protein
VGFVVRIALRQHVPLRWPLATDYQRKAYCNLRLDPN